MYLPKLSLSLLKVLIPQNILIFSFLDIVFGSSCVINWRVLLSELLTHSRKSDLQLGASRLFCSLNCHGKDDVHFTLDLVACSRLETFKQTEVVAN